jgi:pantoate kinase
MLREVSLPLAVSCAFSPCHITGFYHRMMDYSSDLKSGSIGAGVSLAEGVSTRVTVYEATPKNTFDISINGAMTDDAIVSKKVIGDYVRLIKRPLHISVCHETRIPVGFGLGTSGAAALSLSISLNDALRTGLSVTECAQLAHCAELYCKTGLGTVISEFTGGLELRTLAGAPGIGRIEKIPLRGMSVVAICLSPISTSQSISRLEFRLTMKATNFLKQLMLSKSVNDFLRLSYEFSTALKIIGGRCNSVIQLLLSNGFIGSVALFGETVFTLVPNNEINSVLQILKDYDRYCIVADVDNIGARLLKTT